LKINLQTELDKNGVVSPCHERLW